MEEKLFEAFCNLSENHKRNEINAEFQKLHELIISIKHIQGITAPETEVMNYDILEDANMSESEFLNLVYRDVMNIRKAIINYLSWKENE